MSKKPRKSSILTGSVIDPQRFHKSQLKFYAYLVPIVVFMSLPILYIVATAFKPLDELAAFPPRFWVISPTLNNFVDLAKVSGGFGVPVSRYLFNSLLVSAAVVFLTLVLSVTAGYALSKKRFRGRELFGAINTLALMFVPVAVAIPRFLIVAGSGMTNTYLAHIVPLIALPVGLFLLKQFIDQIPDSLLEAARIDGAGDFRILLHVIVPNILPALATVAILSFQTVWNGTETSAFFVTDESLKTFAYSLSVLSSAGSNTAVGQGIAAAAALVQFLPNLVLFVLLQSRVMNTLVHSGIK